MNPALRDVPPKDALLRHTNDIDLTKASKGCRRCHGVGITGHLHRDDKRIPIICRCVIRNGGVAQQSPSMADIRATQGASTADEIVNTALRLPHSMLPMCIKSLDRLASEVPADQKDSARALTIKNARRVLVQRLASITMTADEAGSVPEPKEFT
jgi:hypothetical protein